MRDGASIENTASQQHVPYGEPQPPSQVPSRAVPGARPGRVSGTALPLGVHLSNGAYGSASSLHLLLGGAYIITLLAVAVVTTYIEAWLVQQAFGLSLPWTALQVIADQAVGLDLPFGRSLIHGLILVNFLLVLRLSALSGYHAAEHKVVAAMEQFENLRYDDVVEMPRVHARCGTVLLFGVLLAVAFFFLLLPVHWTLAVLGGLFGWRFRYHTGYFVQNYFTTKPPTPAQLRAGMKAGQALLDRWRQDPDRRVPWLHSLWVRGLPQMLTGLVLAMHLLDYIYANLHIWLDF